VGSAAISAGSKDDPATPLTGFQQLPPHLQNLNQNQYNLAMQQYQTPFQAFGGNRFQQFNPNQNRAMNMVYNRAGGSPTEAAAQSAVQRGASGNANPMFGMNNPYTNKAISDATGDIEKNFNRTTAPMLDAMNSRANTGFGTSSGMDEMRNVAYENLNKQTGQVANDMRMQDLRAQQQMGEGMAGRQLQAANLAPSMQGMDYNNASQLMQMGNTQMSHDQQQNDFDYSEFMRNLGYPQQQMALMSAPFGGMGGTIMQPGQQNQTPNYFNQALGGAMFGQGVSNMMNQRTQPVPPVPSPNYYPGDHQGYGG
jgi:hypothetical protein